MQSCNLVTAKSDWGCWVCEHRTAAQILYNHDFTRDSIANESATPRDGGLQAGAFCNDVRDDAARSISWRRCTHVGD
jgi:hypothetical protein